MDDGIIETTPIAVDGILYVTEPPSTVSALDARSGRRIWTWSPEMGPGRAQHRLPAREPGGRGARLHGVRGNAGRAPGRPRRTLGAPCAGTSRWATTRSASPSPLAPLTVKDKVIVGVSGAEAGVRGYIDAYDAETGELAWRTYTIPAPGEPGSETWGRQQLGDRGRVHLAHRLLRSRTRPALLAHRQPGARLERRRPPRRQPVHGLPARPRSRHRGNDLVLPVHAPRHPRLGTPTRSRCCWTPNGRASRASWW